MVGRHPRGAGARTSAVAQPCLPSRPGGGAADRRRRRPVPRHGAGPATPPDPAMPAPNSSGDDRRAPPDVGWWATPSDPGGMAGVHRRLVAVVAGLALTILGAPAPPAGALAAGACVITGTIVFTPSAAGAEHGAWRIGPAVIKCRGPFRIPHPEQMNGDAGEFTGGGSYAAVRAG